MEARPDKHRPSHGQLIYVPHRDTVRLMEVYVKRSLSVNDGTVRSQLSQRKEKWVMPRRVRRHSSDPSLHLGEVVNDEHIDVFEASDSAKKKRRPRRKSKKNKKKVSLWKSFVGLFSQKITDIEEEQEGSPEPSEEEFDPITSCLPAAASVSVQRRNSKKTLRRRISRRISQIKPFKDEPSVSAGEAVSVEPTYAYYEKVSEELEKIIHEVKEQEEVPPPTNDTDSSKHSSQREGVKEVSEEHMVVSEELEKILLEVNESEDARALTKEEIAQLIVLTMQEGDAIDVKIKENQVLKDFFEGMPYSSFQKLADAYIESEATPTHNPPTVLPTAPELVKLAFTLDFTARIAALTRKNIGYITSLGNRYLKDRFEYQQACSDHPWSDSDD